MTLFSGDTHQHLSGNEQMLCGLNIIQYVYVAGYLVPPQILCGLKVVQNSCFPNGYIKWVSDYPQLVLLVQMSLALIINYCHNVFDLGELLPYMLCSIIQAGSGCMMLRCSSWTLWTSDMSLHQAVSFVPGKLQPQLMFILSLQDDERPRAHRGGEYNNVNDDDFSLLLGALSHRGNHVSSRYLNDIEVLL